MSNHWRKPHMIASVYVPPPIYPRRRSVMEIGAWIGGAAFMTALTYVAIRGYFGSVAMFGEMLLKAGTGR